MRVIAGDLKNRVIVKPRNKSVSTTSEMVREALFNILGNEIIDARFADLFAGSGSVGLEAISRGAKRVTFIENQRGVARSIRKTLELMSVSKDHARVWESDVFSLRENPSEWAVWDIAFLDPPIKIRDNFLDILLDRGTLVPGTLLIVQRPVDFPPSVQSGEVQLIDQRQYGRSALFFYQ